MQRDIGDIIDRFTISKLKAERIGSKESKKEFQAFEEEIFKIPSLYLQLTEETWNQVFEMMYSINNFIWLCESGLKGGKEELKEPLYILSEKNNEALSKIGAMTIMIRNFNHLRVQLKNFINNLIHEGFLDAKQDHLSE